MIFSQYRKSRQLCTVSVKRRKGMGAYRECLSRRCTSFCSLYSRYEFHRRHFSSYIIVDFRASKYVLIPYMYRTMDIVFPSVHTTRSRLPLAHNRRTVNRSSRIKIISLSASGKAWVSVRHRVSDEHPPAEVTFYSAQMKFYHARNIALRQFYLIGQVKD